MKRSDARIKFIEYMELAKGLNSTIAGRLQCAQELLNLELGIGDECDCECTCVTFENYEWEKEIENEKK